MFVLSEFYRGRASKNYPKAAHCSVSIIDYHSAQVNYTKAAHGSVSIIDYHSAQVNYPKAAHGSVSIIDYHSAQVNYTKQLCTYKVTTFISLFMEESGVRNPPLLLT